MSASTERKNRIAAREAGTDMKTLARQEAEKKAVKTRRKWTVGGICVALLLVLVLLLQSGFFYNHTTAVRIGGESFSPAEVNYYYTTAYYEFVNNYGSYASLFGLDTSSGALGLRRQSCPMLENGTWRDYFLQSAYANMARIKGLRDYANAEGLTLSEEQESDLSAQANTLDLMAQAYGYSNADNYLAANYGSGVTAKLAMSVLRDNMLATLGYDHYSDSLVYSDEELEEYYASLEGASDYFDYAVYSVPAETLISDDGTAAVTDGTLLEAKADAEAVMTSYLDDPDTEDLCERLSAAVEGALDEITEISSSHTRGSSLNSAYAEWLKDDSREAGDITVVETSDATGYIVAVFLGRDDNHYHTVSVRHILVEAEKDESGEWSDKVLEVAKARAEDILAEWESGERTEESFAALAEQYSTDSGSNTNGGLYEDVYKGQMVDEFDAFCFGGHKPGDTAIVYGSNGQYAGYHVIYFVGESDELYSSHIARDALSSEAINAWLGEVVPEYKAGAFAWLAGK